MMLPLQEVLNKYCICPKGVIHVGAHWAEEHEEYVRCGINRFTYIEPCKDAFYVLMKKFGFEYSENEYKHYSRGYGDEKMNINLLNYACGEKEGDMTMNVSNDNQGQSNSLLKPLLHLQQHPEVIFDNKEIVRVQPLDYILFEKQNYDFLVMDCQGYEGQVLKGAVNTLKHIDIIYTEINRGQTYEDNMEIEEMDLFLDFHGFTRVETHWPSPNWTWGDAVFIRKTLLQ